MTEKTESRSAIKEQIEALQRTIEALVIERDALALQVSALLSASGSREEKPHG